MRGKRRRRRKCLCCKELFDPDARTADRQRHCGKQACRRASKAWRQRRWLSKAENRDYFRGPDNVERVRRWREQHPGYWRRGGRKGRAALQDDCGSQGVDAQKDASGLRARALQDDCLAQLPLFVGLISSLTDCALQDDIAQTIRRMQAQGQSILGVGPGMQPERRPP